MLVLCLYFIFMLHFTLSSAQSATDSESTVPVCPDPLARGTWERQNDDVCSSRSCALLHEPEELTNLFCSSLQMCEVYCDNYTVTECRCATTPVASTLGIVFGVISIIWCVCAYATRSGGSSTSSV